MVRKSLLLLLILIATPLPATVPKVVVSIAPIHCLVVNIMKGIGTPELLLTGAQSPHDFFLSPSQAKTIVGADLIVWVGEGLETFLVKPIKSFHKKNCAVALAPHLTLLNVRGRGCESHCTNAIDPHVWLDIDNAVAMTDYITQALCALDQENSQQYRSNSTVLKEKLVALKEDVKDRTNALKGLKFICFHDAFQYFEHMVGVTNVGVIGSTHSLDPSLKHLAALKALLRNHEVSCIFSEPQSGSSLLTKLAHEFNLKAGTLDPLGCDIPPGPDEYFLLLKKITQSFITCRESSDASTQP